jgi:hypothetical protein
MSAGETGLSRPDLEQELASLIRRVEEIEAFLRRTSEIVEQGLLGGLVLEATVLSSAPPGIGPDELTEIIRTVLREELGQVIPH